MTKGVRRLSDASPLVSAYLQDRVATDLCKRYDDGSEFVFLSSMAGYSLQLPDNPSSGWDTDVHFTDQRLLRSLEDSGQINWYQKFPKLIPLSVPNDGNSLCHAVSVAIWGVEDKGLVLRKAVCNGLNGALQRKFHQRWSEEWRKVHRAAHNEVPEEDWSTLIGLTTCTNKSSHPNYPLYDPLDYIHVFVIANILRRPIIVYADSYTFGTHIPLGTCAGIHLPLLWSPSECIRSPLLLGYSEGAFAPLVPFCGPFSKPVGPLLRHDMAPLRVRFLHTEEQELWEQLLVNYLNVEEVDILNVMVRVAILEQNPAEETQRLVAEFFKCRGKNADGSTNNLNMVSVQDALPSPGKGRTTRFRCGNRECHEFIEKGHTFPFCERCSSAALHADSDNEEKGAKRKSRFNFQLTPSLGSDSDTMDFPHSSSSTKTFPLCQECYEHSVLVGPPRKELKLEEKWMILAMGMVDERILSQNAEPSDKEEPPLGCLPYRRSPSVMEQEESEPNCGDIPPRIVGAEKPPRKVSATGLRSNPPLLRQTSKGEVHTAKEQDLPRKNSWTTESCASDGCPYFASVCCYPYCNQCASSTGVRRTSFAAATANDTGAQTGGALAN